MHRLVPAAPEFAFLGRSNVGKSSLLNALIGRRSLARVSGTPGKTAFVNAYRLPTLYLLDLPGYGFAAADHATRAGYRQLLESLLQERASLTGVVWLLDARRIPSTDDAEFHALLTASGRAVLAVLTKADKLTRNEQAAAVAARAVDLGIGPDQIQLVSAQTGLGVAELGASLLQASLRGKTGEVA